MDAHNLWRRLIAPWKRRKRKAAGAATAQGFDKARDAQRTSGPALVFADLGGSHGLSCAAVYDLVTIRAQHSVVQVVDIGPFIADKTSERPAIADGCENVYFLCQPDALSSILPGLTPALIARAYRVGRWVWETPIFPEAWRFAENLVHEVWAPSLFCAETFRRALSLPVHVVPHAVTAPARPAVSMRHGLGIPDDIFLGVAIMDIRTCPERKNPWAHVRAWLAAFGSDPTAVLILKVRVGRRTALVLDELREIIGEARNIRLMTHELTREDIAALHHAADAYLSLHRSEGYGLNIHEALACGKPVIATHWSANAEYGPTFRNYHPVDFGLVDYRDWTGHYADTAFQWADADLGAAAETLRSLRDRHHRERAWTTDLAEVA
ncbi:MAG: hypothetical protein JWM36_2562 [Hyphomicrobiales bacterium]|nr:hypothetical protein [Hyphomicrobiales bacterium]